MIDSCILHPTSIVESIVCTSVPDHVSTNSFASSWVVANWLNVTCWSISSKAGQDLSDWHSWAGNSNLRGITECAPVLTAASSIIVGNIIQRLGTLICHQANGISDVLGVTLRVPRFNSDQTLREDGGVTEYWLGDDEVGSESLQLFGKDHDVGSKLLIVTDWILQIEVDAIAFPLSDLSSELFGSVRAWESLFPAGVLTVSVTTNGVDDLGWGAIGNMLTSVLKGRRDYHIVIDECVEDNIELLNPWGDDWLPVTSWWYFLSLAVQNRFSRVS